MQVANSPPRHSDTSLMCVHHRWHITCPYVDLEKERQLGQWANLTTPQTGSGSLELQEGWRAESGEGSAPATTWTLVTANRVGRGYLSTCLCQLHPGPAEGQHVAARI